MERAQNLAELAYSEKYGKIELVVPHGTRTADLAKFSERLFGDLLSRLPRGCTSCFSGEPLLIRERLEHVLHVDLEKMEVIEQG